MAEMSHSAEAGSTQANDQKDSRPVYEVGFHVVPEVTEENVTAVVENIRAQIKAGDAEIIAEGTPHNVKLAYTIEPMPTGRQGASTGKRQKYNEAYFGFIKFATEREHIPALEALLRTTPEILRYLLVQTTREELIAAPRRTVFASDRLEGETLKKPTSAPEKKGDVSEEELEKSIEALVS